MVDKGGASRCVGALLVDLSLSLRRSVKHRPALLVDLFRASFRGSFLIRYDTKLPIVDRERPYPN